MIFIYNAIFVLLFGKILGDKLEKDKYRKWYLVLIFIQMSLIQGLRAVDVGTDTAFYVSVYENYLNSEIYSFLFTHYELGFQLLYQILHVLNFDSQGLLFVVSAITMFLFAYFIYTNSNNVVIRKKRLVPKPVI